MTDKNKILRKEIIDKEEWFEKSRTICDNVVFFVRCDLGFSLKYTQKARTSFYVKNNDHTKAAQKRKLHKKAQKRTHEKRDGE